MTISKKPSSKPTSTKAPKSGAASQPVSAKLQTTRMVDAFKK